VHDTEIIALHAVAAASNRHCIAARECVRGCTFMQRHVARCWRVALRVAWTNKDRPWTSRSYTHSEKTVVEQNAQLLTTVSHHRRSSTSIRFNVRQRCPCWRCAVFSRNR